MLLAGLSEITLPLKNPVLQFSLILFIILFVPFFLKRLKIPSLISLIIAGAVVGPNGLNLMLRDSSIILFGTVGLLYIMFLAGLEIDVADFKKNSGRSILFGFYSFLISFFAGVFVSLFFLNFSLLPSLLIGSIFSSYTLIVYPIISKYGIARDKSVGIAVGGTMITDTLALLVLAVVAGSTSGQLGMAFWIRILIGITLFSVIVLLLFPVIARWFFKRFDDNVLQYLFVLGMVFFAAFLAEAAGVEAIIGAFLGGLALNRLIPHTSPLMNRIRFVGNAIFIPFFLIGVGMLIDARAFFKDFETLNVALVIIVAAGSANYLTALITQKIYGFSVDQRRVIFGLISAHAAVALATVLIGYNTITGYTLDGVPVRLLEEPVLNATILFILVSCTIATLVGEKGAQNIAFAEQAEDAMCTAVTETPERILMPMNDPETVEEVVTLGITLKSPKNRDGLFALHVIDSSAVGGGAEKNADKLLEKAAVAAASTDNRLSGLIRYDGSIVNGIDGVVREQRITDLILSLHYQRGLTDSFLGSLSEMLLITCNVTTFIYKPAQPLATIRRTLAVIPQGAENEDGFMLWKDRLASMVANTGSKLVFYADKQTLSYLKESHAGSFPNAEYKMFRNLNDFSGLAKEIRNDDNLVVVMSRRNYRSYHSRMAKIPSYLSRYFKNNSFILIYPVQSRNDEEVPEFPELTLPDHFRSAVDQAGVKLGEAMTRIPFRRLPLRFKRKA
ncbi:MAG: cation:proton antiporter [Chlorobium sp.]|uniref:cation:proton antiporter n=1 Tax=Chlorobium sp. TaxID=1095 RepID=UPI0025C38746|nr:cation:proton antiporter [Chlorobium sp.]MCF8215619.1 cation:proton antiporter [Chlorobium sp.]MCF8270674.1 cation:proton antiporter [Chlorobium sp.]MCF8286828.1 cation:proton antiporter [Chlorobium sp.]MCF8290596.1 cation:proton antiporter [Chlorobium sp.]MCF8384552.1 cation:proton antiporter [Chlorobium sp.]